MKSRRQSRQFRKDSTREWRDGKLDEEAPERERWSREVKKNRNPLQKLEQSGSYEFQEEEGTVLEVNRRTCLLRSDKGETWNCHFGPNINRRTQAGLVVGDRIKFAPEEGTDGLITSLLPRRNYFFRPGPKDRRNRELILGSNLDGAFIVFSAKDPEFNSLTLDRFLVRMIWQEIRPVVVINKMDLTGELPPEMEYYRKSGVKILELSCETGEGLDDLKSELRGKMNLMTGISGVGKSSIIRLLDPSAETEVGDLRESDNKGRHTTTRSSVYETEKNTWVIDTPGIREMGIFDMEPLELAASFPGFSQIEGQCGFRNCLHREEKKCVIIESVGQGLIPGIRYESYLKMLADEDRSYAKQSSEF